MESDTALDYHEIRFDDDGYTHYLDLKVVLLTNVNCFSVICWNKQVPFLHHHTLAV